MLLLRASPSLVQLTDTGGSPCLKQSFPNVEFSGTERFLSSGFKCGETRKKNLKELRWDYWMYTLQTNEWSSRPATFKNFHPGAIITLVTFLTQKLKPFPSPCHLPRKFDLQSIWTRDTSSNSLKVQETSDVTN